MAGFRTLTSPMVRLVKNDIDTDQIIPARFLKTTTKVGLGEKLFNDWRYDENGAPKADFPLNAPSAKQAQVLLAGDNFGCGSSREHAPWALLDFGFHAVIATSFADIFSNNALKNGVLPIRVDKATHEKLLAQGTDATVTIDLEKAEIALADGSRVTFPVDAFAQRCLLDGVDELGYIQSFSSTIEAYEKAHEA